MSQEAAENKWDTRTDNCQNCPEVKSEHDMYIRACEQISAQKRLIDKLKNRLKNRWISVEEKLPTVDPRYGDIDVLVHMDDGFIATATYDKNNGWELWAESGEVTHWQPLPGPPKGSE